VIYSKEWQVAVGFQPRSQPEAHSKRFLSIFPELIAAMILPGPRLFAVTAECSAPSSRALYGVAST